MQSYEVERWAEHLSQHTHTHTHRRTDTHVCFCVLWGLFIDFYYCYTDQTVFSIPLTYPLQKTCLHCHHWSIYTDWIALNCRQAVKPPEVFDPPYYYSLPAESTIESHASCWPKITRFEANQSHRNNCYGTCMSIHFYFRCYLQCLWSFWAG